METVQQSENPSRTNVIHILDKNVLTGHPLVVIMRGRENASFTLFRQQVQGSWIDIMSLSKLSWRDSGKQIELKYPIRSSPTTRLLFNDKKIILLHRHLEQLKIELHSTAVKSVFILKRIK